MKKRFHLLIIIGLLIVGFIVGSINEIDLKIDQALYTPNNGFGLFMASFGVYPCYIGLGFVGGGLLCTTLRRKELPMWARIIGYGLSAAAYIVGVYSCGKEWPSVNGHNVSNLAWLSYLISAIVLAGSFVLGYWVSRKGNQKQLWGILLAMSFVFLLGLLPAGVLIKLVIHRPRYRYAVFYEDLPFYNWWQMFPEYKYHIGDIVGDGIKLTKEEFKSFPSGHSGTGMILAMILPFAAYFFPKLKGKETLLFYGGVLYSLVMMFSRLLVGAHYLTDVCMGSLIIMIVYYVANEVAYRKGLFNDPVPEETVIQAE